MQSNQGKKRSALPAFYVGAQAAMLHMELITSAFRDTVPNLKNNTDSSGMTRLAPFFKNSFTTEKEEVVLYVSLCFQFALAAAWCISLPSSAQSGFG
jgi:hypothetical protein